MKIIKTSLWNKVQMTFSLITSTHKTNTQKAQISMMMLIRPWHLSTLSREVELLTWKIRSLTSLIHSTIPAAPRLLLLWVYTRSWWLEWRILRKWSLFSWCVPSKRCSKKMSNTKILKCRLECSWFYWLLNFTTRRKLEYGPKISAK